MTIAQVLLFVVLTGIFVVFAIDLVPVLATFLARRGIGNWNEQSTWTAAIANVAERWLKRTPTVSLTDNRRLVVVDILLGRYRRSSIQHWQDAALLLGLTEEQEHRPDPNRLQRIRTFTSSQVVSGSWRKPPSEVDGAILAFALFEAAENPEEIRPALDQAWNLIQERLGPDGTVRYRSHMSDFRYVDTIGFVCPFLVRYGQLFDVKEAVELALRQIAAFDVALLHGTSIPAHAYSIESLLPSGLHGWGRGLGWYAIGLADAWYALDDDHPQKPELEDRVKRLTADVVKLQRANGGWGWNLTNPHAATDSSATAMLAWFLTRAAAVAEIREVAIAARERALVRLMSATRRDGVIDFSQGDTKDIGVHSQLFDIMPFTQGFALRCVAHKL